MSASVSGAVVFMIPASKVSQVAPDGVASHAPWSNVHNLVNIDPSTLDALPDESPNNDAYGHNSGIGPASQGYVQHSSRLVMQCDPADAIVTIVGNDRFTYPVDGLTMINMVADPQTSTSWEHINHSPDLDPDTTWLTAWGNGASGVQAPMQKPALKPSRVFQAQTLRARIRKNASGGNNIGFRFNLYKGHDFVLTAVLATLSSDEAVVEFPWTFDPAIWSPDGSDVRVELLQTDGHIGTLKRFLEVGAIEWRVGYDAVVGGIEALPSNAELNDLTMQVRIGKNPSNWGLLLTEYSHDIAGISEFKHAQVFDSPEPQPIPTLTAGQATEPWGTTVDEFVVYPFFGGQPLLSDILQNPFNVAIAVEHDSGVDAPAETPIVRVNYVRVRAEWSAITEGAIPHASSRFELSVYGDIDKIQTLSTAGSAPMSLDADGAGLALSGSLAGTTILELSATGDISYSTGFIDLAGTALLDLAASGDIIRVAGLAGSAEMGMLASGDLRKLGGLSAGVSMQITTEAGLLKDAPLSVNEDGCRLSFTTSADLSRIGILGGAGALNISGQADIAGTFNLAADSDLALSSDASLHRIMGLAADSEITLGAALSLRRILGLAGASDLSLDAGAEITFVYESFALPEYTITFQPKERTYVYP